MRLSLNYQEPSAPPAFRGRLPVFAPAMTRCECAGISFAAIGRRLEAGETLADVMRATGFGSLCTACIPDLETFLASGGR